jgi:sirohydrochlorin ferrochelatase
VAQGAECLILVPYFLSAGIHVRRDLSAARARLADRFPQVKVCLAEPFGRHPLLVDLVVLRAGEAVQKGPQEKKSDTPGVST